MNSPAEATFEPERNPAVHGVNYYLSVTAETPERARTELANLAGALKAAFPSAERNLMVHLNHSTVPAPNDLSRCIRIGIQAAVVLLMVGAQVLIEVPVRVIGRVVSARSRPGFGRGENQDSERRRNGGKETGAADALAVCADNVLLLLAPTPVSVIVALWLTRRSRAAAAGVATLRAAVLWARTHDGRAACRAGEADSQPSPFCLLDEVDAPRRCLFMSQRL